MDKQWFSSRDDCRNDDGGVESILTAKVVVFVLEPTFPILLVYGEIQLIAVTLMTYSRARAPELRMITRDSY